MPEKREGVNIVRGHHLWQRLMQISISRIWRYACWCEKTTDTKKALIADCKATIDEKSKSSCEL